MVLIIQITGPRQFSGLDGDNVGWPNYVAFDLNPGVVKVQQKFASTAPPCLSFAIVSPKIPIIVV